MKRRSPSGNLRASRLALSRYVFSSNKSLLASSQRHLSAAHLSFQQLFFSPGWVLCFPAPLRGIAKPTLPSIEFA